MNPRRQTPQPNGDVLDRFPRDPHRPKDEPPVGTNRHPAAASAAAAWIPPEAATSTGPPHEARNSRPVRRTLALAVPKAGSSVVRCGNSGNLLRLWDRWRMFRVIGGGRGLRGRRPRLSRGIRSVVRMERQGVDLWRGMLVCRAKLRRRNRWVSCVYPACTGKS